METEELIGIIVGTGAAPGLIFIIAKLIKKLCDTYKDKKKKGYSTLEAINAAIKSINIKEPKGKK